MIIVMIILMAIGAWVTRDDPNACAGCIGAEWVIAICMFIVIGNLYNTSYLIPSKIAMYEEENAVIESKIEATVEKYMEFEQGIIFEIAPDEDCMTLISLYPELKSDTLIQSEIEVYLKNNNKIKELKEKQINKSLWKFLLFFGH